MNAREFVSLIYKDWAAELEVFEPPVELAADWKIGGWETLLYYQKNLKHRILFNNQFVVPLVGFIALFRDTSCKRYARAQIIKTNHFKCHEYLINRFLGFDNNYEAVVFRKHKKQWVVCDTIIDVPF